MESGPVSGVTAELEQKIATEGKLIRSVLDEMQRRIVGQKDVLERMLMAVIADGHVLLEGLPGLAKTTAIKALGEVASLKFSRVQFTPDLLPADVIGTQIYDPKGGDFRVRKGPIFGNLILADEINRAPAKVQSALLEAMQERQVTIGGETFHLDRPFLVLATQNPIEQEGTYPLPEAQVDRFLFKIKVTYGTMLEEREIIAREHSLSEQTPLKPILSGADILRLQQLTREVYVSDKLRDYIVQLVFATRHPEKFGLADIKHMILCGASPRASINLERAARVNAIFQGRAYVTPQDIKDIGMEVLRHRIIPSYEAEAENITSDNLVTRIFNRVEVP